MLTSPTYPLSTLACTIDSTGISAPTYDQILSSLQTSFRSIYGSDLYLDPDGQDMQMLAVFALAIYDSNQAAIAVYNEFSPATAVGAGLSSVVKINGLLRLVSTNSTVGVVITGVGGTVITNGAVSDDLGTLWALPPSVVIDPIQGDVQVTATSTVPGAIQAGIGTVTGIATPTRGWQTVTNPLAAVIGAPVETDAALRERQSISTALPSLSVKDGINAAVAAVNQVQRLETYENDTNSTDVNGIPPHSISVVVEGGDETDICNAIGVKKTPGCFTYGDTAQIVLDQQGMPNTIAYFPLRLITILVEITIMPLPGFTSTIKDNIAQSVASQITALPIGYDVYLSKVYAFSELPVDQGGLTYDVTKIRLRRQGTFIWNAADPSFHGWNFGRWDGPFMEGDVSIAFNEAAICDAVADIVWIQLAPGLPRAMGGGTTGRSRLVAWR
jgi:uncharacterized phage protein gp47/JayE